MNKQKTCIFSISFLFLSSLLLFSGCGNGNVRLSGKVMLDDGSPVSKGTIYFINGDFQASGDINQDGSFVVGSLGTKDGLPPGDYTVYFGGVNVQQDSGAIERIINEKYEMVGTTDLKYSITSSTRTLDIKVEKP